ncbi:hypothetical protein EYF80_004411 [Liparis tanakae]|uniref:Uncharacterized protein n=1 Tax=Liparis tanakae TaxID=230148 RepID=A0A4Z2J5A7_9TELE|nr:hypothetical protein EYF80_004411 [Liparis tanakae]
MDKQPKQLGPKPRGTISDEEGAVLVPAGQQHLLRILPLCGVGKIPSENQRRCNRKQSRSKRMAL